MHEFIFEQASYTGQEPGLDLPEGVDDQNGVSLRKALEGGSSFTWVYDYGDNWQHKVKVERSVDMVVPLEHPMCVTGQGACPPEDIGGVPGYQEFLQAMAVPVHPEHAEIMRRHGGPFDPAAFSADEVQARFNECRLRTIATPVSSRASGGRLLLHKDSCTRCSSPSSPPRRWAKAPAWA